MTPPDPPRTPPSGAPLAPASTVACLRNTAAGLEVLMVQRHTKLAFHGGAWVFPGGRVDPGDATDSDPYEEPAARLAAVRESQEEAALRLDPASLVTLSHWTTPPGRPRRFATWFFLGEMADAQPVRVDGLEISAHRWLRAEQALAEQAAGAISLPPPTFVTLLWLTRFARAADALASAQAGVVERFVPRPVATPEGAVVSLYAEDAGYERRDPTLPGARHRLIMGRGAWRYERRG